MNTKISFSHMAKKIVFLFFLLGIPVFVHAEFIELLVATSGTCHTNRPKEEWTQADWEEYARGNVQQGYVIDARSETGLKKRPWGKLERDRKRFVILRVPDKDFDPQLLQSSGSLLRTKRIPLEKFLSEKQIINLKSIPYNDKTELPAVKVELPKKTLAGIVEDVTNIQLVPDDIKLHGSSGTFYLPGDYSALSTAVTTEASVLTDDCNFIINGSIVDTTAVSISGYTTYVTATIVIQATGSARHEGKWDDSKYSLSVNNSNGIKTYEDYIKIDGLQIKVSHPSAAGDGIRIQETNTNNRIEICNNILQGVFSGGTYEGSGIYSIDSSNILYIWNNISYRWVNVDVINYGMYLHYGLSHYVYNNTIYGNRIGIRANNNIIAINNISANNTHSQDFYGDYSTGTSFNSTDSTDTPTGGTDTYTNQSYSFINSASGDFHLQSDDTGALDKGSPTFTGNGVFSNDIDGEARSGTWDIGADEFVEEETVRNALFFGVMF